MPTLEELRRQILFDGLSDEELSKLVGVLEERVYKEGEMIFSEGDDTSGLYMVRSGEVELTRSLPIDLKTKMLITVRNVHNCCEIRKTPRGWKQVLSNLIEGQFFGEFSVTEGRTKHSTNAEALENTGVLLLRKETFFEIEKSEPKTTLKMHKNIARITSKSIRLIDRQLLKLIMGI
ncbi:MAG: cyclic nucleotide-binding domain-containing protein [Candidatus Magnetoovum sp. WYHC-5]|nr:cyclic nucleotide-binding domain-containing protein [Candidatus Magnetoovum sp. WYHC-5]